MLQTGQTEVYATSPKQRSLCSGAAEGVCAHLTLAADAMLVKSKSSGVNLKQLFLRVPVLALAAHPFAKDARVQFAATRIAYAVQNAIGFGRELLAQARFEIRRDAAGQAQHVDERSVGAAVFRAL